MNKETIINTYDKGEFSRFLSNDNTGMVLSLLDDEGLEILKKYKYTAERINYMIVYSKYINELFKNPKFVSIFLSTDVFEYYANLHLINLESNYILLDAAIKEGKDIHYLSKLFGYFNIDQKCEILKNWRYSKDLFYQIFKDDFEKVGIFMLKNFDIDLNSHDIDLARIFAVGKDIFLRASAYKKTRGIEEETLFIKDSDIPNSLIEKLWDTHDVFEYRTIVNNAAYSCDPERFEKLAEKREEERILNIDENGLIEPFTSIYKHMVNASYYKRGTEEYDKEMGSAFDLLKNQKDLFNMMFKFSFSPDDELFLNELKSISNKYISNYIVDYLFKEYYYNVICDLEELLNFYYAGNIKIPEDRLYFYEKILHLDELPYEDKIETFNYGKTFNVIESFYDDMSFARDIVGQAIKDNSLTREELEEYLDEELTEKYGVPVYNIKDNPFFAIVKSGRASDYYPTGHSFSLIGCGCVGTFDLPSDASTYLYDADTLNPRQIVHVYPTDSYTLYKPFQFSSDATRRVRPLMMPDELLYETYMYNELLILEKGMKETEIDERIPELQKMAIYAINEITTGHVEMAKLNGVGIFLVNSNEYARAIEQPDSVYRHQNMGITYGEYNYFRDEYNRDKFEAKRK